MDAAIDATLSKKYPAKAHCRRVAEYLKANGQTGIDSSILYVEAAHSHMNEDNDQEAPFRQRRYFFYLTGCELPNSAAMYDVGKDKLTLFIPPIDPDEVIWSGLPLTPPEAVQKYDIDAALTHDDLNSSLSGAETSKGTIYAIENQISPQVVFPTSATKDISALKPAIEECRVVKDDYEIALTRRANQISERAHVAVMKAARAAQSESQLEALFLQHCVAQGCRKQSYDPIFATGTDAATLHYVKNDKAITPAQLNLLLDAGAELSCYASDITRTFPISGKFTPESRAIYALVLRMQKECMAVLKAGVDWTEVHALAHGVAVAGLLELGILRGGTVDEVYRSGVSAAFFPHGLGHFLGMDTHDCGGRPNYADPDPRFRYLRVRRALPAGSVITVEPGLYFCRFIIEPALKVPEKAKYIDEQVLERYWSVGGVRIEDNVLITQDGIRNLTSVPKEIDEIEALVSG